MNEVSAGKTQAGDKQPRSDGAERSEGAGGRTVLDALERLTESELDEVVKRCGEILASREKERRQEALKEIQRIAKEHGLNVDVKGMAAKRRRGPKAKA